MSRHDFTVKSHPGIGTVICCVGCQDPESLECDYVWVDSDQTVYFDGSNVTQLINFIAQHDAFGLTKELVIWRGPIRYPQNSAKENNDNDKNEQNGLLAPFESVTLASDMPHVTTEPQ